MRAAPPNAPRRSPTLTSICTRKYVHEAVKAEAARTQIHMDCGALGAAFEVSTKLPNERRASNQRRPPKMPTNRLRLSAILLITALLSPLLSSAQTPYLTPAARSILDQIYSGDLTA